MNIKLFVRRDRLGWQWNAIPPHLWCFADCDAETGLYSCRSAQTATFTTHSPPKYWAGHVLAAPSNFAPLPLHHFERAEPGVRHCIRLGFRHEVRCLWTRSSESASNRLQPAAAGCRLSQNSSHSAASRQRSTVFGWHCTYGGVWESDV